MTTRKNLRVARKRKRVRVQFKSPTRRSPLAKIEQASHRGVGGRIACHPYKLLRDEQNAASVSSIFRTPTVMARDSQHLVKMATLGKPRINTERRVARLAPIIGKSVVEQRHNGRAV